MKAKLGRLFFMAILSLVVIGFYSTSKIVFAKGGTTSASGWEKHDNGNGECEHGKKFKCNKCKKGCVRLQKKTPGKQQKGNINISGTVAAKAFSGTSPLILEAPIGTERMRITESGNVGIGTMNPTNKLDVAGGVAVGAGYSGTSAVPTNGMIIEGPVGIGTTSPGAKLEVNGDITISGSNGRIGKDSSGFLTFFTNQSKGIRFKDDSGKTLVEIIGTSSGLASGTVIVGEGDLIVIKDNVGIGTTSPDHDLEIGTGTFSEIDAGEAQFTTSSSREYKENIVPVHVKDILETISSIPVNTYDFREEYRDGDDEKYKNKLGLIAEDFHTVFRRGSDKEINGQEVQMALWLAVQELKAVNDVLKRETMETKNEIKQLIAENGKLRNTLAALAERQESIEDMLLVMSTTLHDKKLSKLDDKIKLTK